MYTEYCIDVHTVNNAYARYTFPCVIHSFKRLCLHTQELLKHITAVASRHRSQSKKYPTFQKRHSRKQTCTGSMYISDHSLLLGHSWAGRLRRPTHHLEGHERKTCATTCRMCHFFERKITHIIFFLSAEEFLHFAFFLLNFLNCHFHEFFSQAF